MLKRIDTFTWIVVGTVLALLIAALVTVNLTGGAGSESLEYLAEDSPQAAVYNAFVALQKGDMNQARTYYSTQVLEEMDGDMYRDQMRYRIQDQRMRRMRITQVDMDATDPNRALVSYSLDNFYRGGPFNSGSTYTNTGVVNVVREDGTWKLDTPEFFY
jgi:acyl-CoA synthetase (AMP-forming)/AMP-acid ligase II